MTLRRRHLRRTRARFEQDVPAGGGRQESGRGPGRSGGSPCVLRRTVASHAAPRTVAHPAPHRRHRRIARRPPSRTRVLRLGTADHAGTSSGAPRRGELPLLRGSDRRANRRHLQGARRQINYVNRKPIGVAGLITPWNTPFMLESWKLAPAPDRQHGRTQARRVHAAVGVAVGGHLRGGGAPHGVFNLVHGLGEDAGDALVKHPDVPLISFTGESSTGQLIFGNAAPHLKGLSMELGGKSPAVVFADADLDAAIDATIFGVFSLNGERCTAGARILVERTVLRRVRRAVRDAGETGRRRVPARPSHRSRRARAPRALRQGHAIRRDR
ncbi:MAG: aldehyde dehydrogenase family protein [Chloroflexia bacterium]